MPTKASAKPKASTKSTKVKDINLKINNIDISVPAGTKIYDAARKAGFSIPTLCYLKGICNDGSCRICVVEVKGEKNLVTSCYAAVREGMEVFTTTQKVLKDRKITLELLLSDHKVDCPSCPRAGACELKTLSNQYGCDMNRYPGKKNEYQIDDSSGFLVRDNNRCILCRRCVHMCNKIQSVGVIGVNHRGFHTDIGQAFEAELKDSPCVACGLCINVCPVGALTEKDDTQKILDAIQDSSKHVIVGVAPAVRVALGEEFGHPIGTDVEGKMISSLKMLGFDKVFDVSMAADLTIMEEGTELLHRLHDEDAKLPMITSCSPGWVNFVEYYYPELLGHISSCKSPQQMFGAIMKTYYAEKFELDPKNIFVATIMPCIAKKTEILRGSQATADAQDVDAVITTRELARLIKKASIEFNKLPIGDWDNPLGVGSTAGLIFGTTGGVMEASLRTLSETINKKPLKDLDFKKVRGIEYIKEASVDLDEIGKLNVAVVHTLGEARKILEQIKEGKSEYHFIEVMACSGGCVGGGGQPIVCSDIINDNIDIPSARAKAMYSKDKKSGSRKSHENPIIQEVYREYLGEVGGDKAHKILHTKHKKRIRHP
ncbi:MAG: NADH-dependent [FeFe] hydrogenase, group A6 [Firmicutes bacterium]|nr:NADH-dependent [FeFe] hydrogenase, group A6 [Bacillota bacterium]